MAPAIGDKAGVAVLLAVAIDNPPHLIAMGNQVRPLHLFGIVCLRLDGGSLVFPAVGDNAGVAALVAVAIDKPPHLEYPPHEYRQGRSNDESHSGPEQRGPP